MQTRFARLQGTAAFGIEQARTKAATRVSHVVQSPHDFKGLGRKAISRNQATRQAARLNNILNFRRQTVQLS